MSDIPRVFVSSTYYDLKQIRQDLWRAISDIGLVPIASEFESFPVNPDISAVENCISVVKQSADIFILIIGKRYGYVGANKAKSVTNLEYLAAASKQIPIFVFLDREIISSLAIYKNNPQADFAGIVDNVALFDFAIEIREKEGRWVFPFESAQDIVSSIKPQFARLLKDGLVTRSILRRPGMEWLTSISPRAYRFATMQETGWEYFLFAQVLSDGIDEAKAARFQQKLGIIDHRRVERIDAVDFFGYAGAQIRSLDVIVRSCNIIFETMLPQAMKEPGVPASGEEICMSGRQLASLYRSMLDWSLGVQACLVHSKLRPVLNKLAHCMEGSLAAIEEFGPRAIKQLEEALQNASKENPAVLDLTLTLNLDDGLVEALGRASEDILSDPGSYAYDDDEETTI